MSIIKHSVIRIDGSSPAAISGYFMMGYQANVANLAGGGAGQSVTTTVIFSEKILPCSQATGYADFSANPANNDTLTIGGTAITFVTSGATGNQVNIGTSLAATLASLLALCKGSADANLVKFVYGISGASGNRFNANAAEPGSGGNALTLAKSSSAITLSAATLTGGAGNYSVQVTCGQDAVPYVTNKKADRFDVVLTPRLAANTLAAGSFDVVVNA